MWSCPVRNNKTAKTQSEIPCGASDCVFLFTDFSRQVSALLLEDKKTPYLRAHIKTDLSDIYELPDFVATLREAYIDKFVVTDRSTGLMEGLHNLEAAGCTMISLIKLSKSEKRWGGSETIISPGILFEIK